MSCGIATVSSSGASSCSAATVDASSIKSAISASAARSCSELADFSGSTSSSAISASVANSSSGCDRTGPELDAGARLDGAGFDGRFPSFDGATSISLAADLWVSLLALDGGPGGNEGSRQTRLVEEASEPSVSCTFCAWCMCICRSTCARSREMRRLARSCKTRWCRRQMAATQHASSTKTGSSAQWRWTWELAGGKGGDVGGKGGDVGGGDGGGVQPGANAPYAPHVSGHITAT